MRFQIEYLCREYIITDSDAQEQIREQIVSSKIELDRLYEKGEEHKHHQSIYNSKVVVPCLFNSGCAIGKRGITLIEIEDDRIALVHWFDRERGFRHFNEREDAAELLADIAARGIS